MKTGMEFVNVSYTWPGGKGLHAVDLKIAPGDFVMIAGPSGSGKSTLLRLAARLEEPGTGVIRFEGTPLAEYAPPQLRRRIGFVQQTPVVAEGTVRDNLLLPFGFAVNRAVTTPDDATLRGWLERLALAGVRLEDDARALSVGQRQRLCIIRSLLLRPALLLMDEPTSALDRESREIVERMTEELNAEGMTVLMVSHSDYCPVSAHRCLTVREGRVEEAA